MTTVKYFKADIDHCNNLQCPYIITVMYIITKNTEEEEFRKFLYAQYKRPEKLNTIPKSYDTAATKQIIQQKQSTPSSTVATKTNMFSKSTASSIYDGSKKCRNRHQIRHRKTYNLIIYN